MDLTLILVYSSAIFAAAIALAVLFHERRSLPHWFLFAGILACAIESLFFGIALEALSPEEILYWQNWKLRAMSLLPGCWLAFSLTYFRGNGREFLRKWRFPLFASVLLPVTASSGILGQLIVSIGKKATENQWMLGFGISGVLLHLSLIIVGVLILMNLERTFRATVGVMRWRIKFVILAVALLWAVRVYTSSQSLLFRAESVRLQVFDSAALLLASLLLLRSLRRAGPFEANVYPSSGLLHSSFTALLAGVYLVMVGALSKIANLVSGDFAFELRALLLLASLVLLAVLLLSEKVRSFTRRFVSRHFHRPLHDYRIIWKNFTEGTARRLEHAGLSEAVAKLVSEIFQALSVSIWLLDDRKEKLLFAASTSLSHAKAGQLQLEPADLTLVCDGLRSHPEPVDIDSSKAVWAFLLRRLHPDEFRKGGNRICVPIVSGNELLGLMILGDRVSGEPFWPQDFDLLKTISEQAAACLLNIQLSQKLLQAKQVEAFQTMSTFFVHDLKNTASTLSLMLQNLPVHFNDPAFREDALRGVSKTVSHINDLIGRLSLLRQDLRLQPIDSDLNDLVAAALKRLADVPSVELARELRPLPRVRVDRAQIESVITNLVLNARDALHAGGRIEVETNRQNGCVVLSVSDNGCGMTPEFLQHSLFRPFQSTKQKGIGIGMFQCKSIVEAHHGRIEVDSKPGKGTVFRVLLPVAAA